MFEFSQYAFNPHAVLILAAGLITLGLGLFVYASHKTAPANRHFLFLCLSITVWLCATGVGLLSRNPAVSILWFKIDNAGVMFISAAFYAFSVNFLELQRPYSTALGYCGAFALALLALFTDSLVIGVHDYWWGYYPQWGITSVPFLTFFFIYMAAAFTAYFTSYREITSPFRRNQVRYVLIACLIGYTGSVDYLPAFGYSVYPFGYLPIFVLISVLAFAILRYRLMDITVVINKGAAYGFLLAAIFVPIYLAVVASQRATPYSIPPLFAGTLLLACGLWVLMKDPRALSNITFSLVCGGASVWLFSFFMVYSSADETEAHFWGKCVYVGVVYIPALVYHFCASLLHRQAYNRLIVSNYLISTVFLLLIPTPYLINGQHRYFWGYYPAAGIMHPVFLLYFVAIGGFSLYQLYHGYRAAEAHSPMEAARLKYVFWAFAIGYVASFDFVQSYGYEFYPIGYVLTCLFALIVTSAIVKFQLMGGAHIPATPKVLPYLQALGLIPVYAVVLLLIRLFTGSTHYLLAGILLATFLAFAGVLAGLQKRIEKTIERVLFRQRYDAYETLIEFSKAMVTILDLNALSSTIMATLSRVLGIERMSVFLLDKEKSQFYLASAHGINRQDIQTLKFSSSDMFPHYLSETRSIVVLEELRHILHSSTLRPVLETLSLLDAEVCLPLINKDRLIGFFNLGPRASHSSYSEAEINLLTTLAQNAAVALDNAILYEDLRRSQILMRRTDRLRSLETIAGGFAHEIRNPLTSIKTFVQLAPERRHDEEFIGQFNHVVLEDVYRIERLIQEILDYARYMEPKFAEEDLNDVVSSCLYFVEVKAESKGILIEKSLARDLPRVMVDRQQLKQVLLNLLLNALEAMGNLGGRLLVRTRQLAKPGDGWIQIEVRDTGSGIAPADLDHIFDPFYTTKHQSDEREGTGLGLTIVHQIVQEHHGYIEVESQLGSGTTFFINLPMVQPHVAVAK